MDPNLPEILPTPESKAQDDSGTQDVDKTTKSGGSFGKQISPATPDAEREGTTKAP